MIVITVLGTSYGKGMINNAADRKEYDANNLEAAHFVQTHYPMYQDINVMVFIGFGFLMTFLKTHSWSAIGFNFIIACWAIQWTILCEGFWNMSLVGNAIAPIELNVKSLIIGDYGAAACLITYGALVGKVTFAQMYMLVTLEVIFYTLNKVICIRVLGAVDAGGSMTIHMFGAYFGLTSTFFFKSRKAIKDEFD
jgi:ammonium transporter Rh